MAHKLREELQPIAKAIEAELKRQCEESGPYGQLHYLSINDDGLAQIEGAIDIDQLTTAVTRAVLDAQAELLPKLNCTEATMEKVKAGLLALYLRMNSGIAKVGVAIKGGTDAE